MKAAEPTPIFDTLSQGTEVRKILTRPHWSYDRAFAEAEARIKKTAKVKKAPKKK